jgi:methionine-S-sulfoxide reductase
MPGVVRTRVGYAGGTKASPTYRDLGDHTEAIEVDYDPAVVTYETLLKVFWESHDATCRPYSTQYKAVVWYRDEEQKRLALASRAREAARRGRDVFTEVRPAGVFTLAEDYHQKYALRHDRALLKELQAYYPAAKDLVASTAAARLNGYLDGHGTLDQLRAELPALGLSPDASRHLTDLVSNR